MIYYFKLKYDIKYVINKDKFKIFQKILILSVFTLLLTGFLHLN